jgi:uncharacterized protein
MQIHYLEIVTTDVDVTCNAYSRLHNVTFSAAKPEFGNARIGELENGGMIGIRAPMHESEHPIVRPYLLVEDIEVAIEAVVSLGGEVIHAPLEIAGYGKFAIYTQGKNHHGLWQR